MTTQETIDGESELSQDSHSRILPAQVSLTNLWRCHVRFWKRLLKKCGRRRHDSKISTDDRMRLDNRNYLHVKKVVELRVREDSSLELMCIY